MHKVPEGAHPAVAAGVDAIIEHLARSPADAAAVAEEVEAKGKDEVAKSPRKTTSIWAKAGGFFHDTGEGGVSPHQPFHCSSGHSPRTGPNMLRPRMKAPKPSMARWANLSSGPVSPSSFPSI